MAKQLELKGTVHRCARCHRELRSPASIKCRMGKKCERITQAEIQRRGMCGMAQPGVALGAQDVP
jgi:hypothetical protein